MDCSSTLIGTLRSTTFIAFITAALMGCGNASAGAAAQQTVEFEPDWEVQPNLWSPRAILIPRSNPPIQPVDSTRDSGNMGMRHGAMGDSSRVDTGRVDSTRGHSTKADLPGLDSATAGSLPGSTATAAARKPKRSSFNISPSDSARWPVQALPPFFL